MQSEDRLIHFATELVHKPLKHSRPALQKLYYELSQTRVASYDSSDFSQPTHARFHSRRGQRSESVLVFLPDRVTIIEEWADIALSDYVEKVKEIGQRVLTDLGISQFAAQTATLRSTFALTHFDDAREFVLDRICGQAGRIAPHFRRPLATGGLRFVLPQTPENPGNLHVLIESFKNSANEIFVEVKGIFGGIGIEAKSMETAAENIQLCRNFISESIFPFLNEYDTPKEDLV